MKVVSPSPNSAWRSLERAWKSSLISALFSWSSTEMELDFRPTSSVSSLKDQDFFIYAMNALNSSWIVSNDESVYRKSAGSKYTNLTSSVAEPGGPPGSISTR